MTTPKIPDYSGQPCKSIIADNINAVKNGKELTASLSYLNNSCEFKKKYAIIVGEFERQDRDEKKAYKKAYQQSDKYKAYKKAYQQSDKYKARLKAYYQSDKYKAYQKAYRQSDKSKAYQQSDKYKARRKVYYLSIRSKTFPGIAKAMANQWGNFVEDKLTKNKKETKDGK